MSHGDQAEGIYALGRQKAKDKDPLPDVNVVDKGVENEQRVALTGVLGTEAESRTCEE